MSDKCPKCGQKRATVDDVRRHDAEFESRDKECAAWSTESTRKRCWCMDLCWGVELKSVECPHMNLWPEFKGASHD